MIGQRSMLVTLAAIAMLAAPVFGQNLLTNGGFEAAPGAEWTPTGGATVQRDSGIWGPGGPQEGTHWGSVQAGGNGNLGAYQDVGATSGVPLELTGWWSAGICGEAGDCLGTQRSATFFVRLHNGANQNAPVLAQNTQTLFSPASFGWTALSGIMGTPTGSTATVSFGWQGLAGWSAATAIHVDDLDLFSSTDCGSQHALDPNPITPDTQPNNADLVGATITGTNLTGVTAVKLVQGGTTLTGTNVVVNGPGTQITADFPTNGAPLGTYDLVVEKALNPIPCNTQTAVGVFQIICPGQATLNVNPISPTSNGNASDTIGATVDGSNLTGLSTVKLVMGGTELIGTNVAVNGGGTQLTADFPTNGAPLGFYNLVVQKAPCPDAVASNAFEVTCAGGGPVQLATVNNDRGKSGTMHTIEITGNGLASISQIQLIKSQNNNHPTRPGGAGNPIVCGAPAPSAGGIEVTCDLTDAEAGRYEVRAIHPCGPSFVTDLSGGGFQTALLIYMPLDQTTDGHGNIRLVSNGSFEEGYLGDGAYDPPVCEINLDNGENPKPLHWEWKHYGSGGDPVFGGSTSNNGWENDNPPLRDKALGFDADSCTNGAPGPGERIQGVTGDHYSDVTFLDGDGGQFILFQTVDISPLLDGNDQLIADLSVRADFWVHGASQPTLLNAHIDLIDGVEGTTGTTAVASAPIAAQVDNIFYSDANYVATVPAGTTWISFTGSGDALLTVRLRLSGQSHGDPNPFRIMRADNVRTGAFVAPGCNIPFADADGDSDVDQDDFAILQLCITGGVGPIPADPAYCTCFERTGDSLITQSDLQEFENCATGPTVQFVAIDHPMCTP